MMILGPVYNAAHGAVNPWFVIVVGSAGLIITWAKYWKGELRQGTHLGILLGISGICTLFIALGLWEFFH
jgi:hypothetical protein